MIVFSDMDGTLLTSDKQMSDATWAMLDELVRRGIEFVPYGTRAFAVGHL